MSGYYRSKNRTVILKADQRIAYFEALDLAGILSARGLTMTGTVAQCHGAPFILRRGQSMHVLASYV